MTTPVETYRGVPIFRSRLILCLPGNVSSPGDVWYEAKIGGWLFVGSLERLRRAIDEKLGPPEPDPSA
jgi:hypothetical protein